MLKRIDMKRIFFLGWQTWAETAFFKLAEVTRGVAAEAALLATALPTFIQLGTQPPPILHISCPQYKPFLRAQSRCQARHHAALIPAVPNQAKPPCGHWLAARGCDARNRCSSSLFVRGMSDDV